MVLRISDVLSLGLLLISFAVAPVAAAEDDAEFAFNLFSDVAPILALFGEQFARQFLSESLTWLDHLIFAMVPLGIVTAVTGAIRVQGPHIAKAFIGRARENRALVEFELMSSTSHEVGEAFNGKGIVRVMGQPKIAEFLIFPKEYKTAEGFFNIKDETQRNAEESEKHELCGIHSLDSVIQPDHGMMQCDYYHSYSYGLIQSWLKASLKRVHTDTERGSSEEQPQKPALKSVKELGPPNLQLNFSSDHVDTYRYTKRIELISAAMLAVIIQVGLFVLAGTSTLYRPLQGSIGFEAKVYGFPCYLAGSILLSFGVGLCSYAVERNTTEYVWTILENQKGSKDEAKEEAKNGDDMDLYPHLIFLQKKQVVNDQAFGAFAMLAGPKRRILASARNEASATDTHKDKDKTGRERRWELMTVGAAASAGLGFTSQFMGLRGLTYPCSIAQIGAIITMTLLRAAIRRRMGREPANCEVFADYELDYLAMRIVFDPDFRRHRESLQGRKDQEGTVPGDACFWEVKLPQSTKYGPRERCPVTRTGSIRDSSSQKGGENLVTTPPTATSEQLIRVRKRLGDLCRWSSKASEAALVLCKSIEHFMDTFFPPKENNGCSFSWPIEGWHGGANESTESAREHATVVLSISCEQEEWNIDMGKVEAILSLWMASIEAENERKRTKKEEDETKRKKKEEDETKRKKKDEDKTKSRPQASPSSKKQSEWRRGGGISSDRHSFYRILGKDDKDGVLRRDLSWWIGGPFTIQGRSRGDDSGYTDYSDDSYDSDDTEDTDDAQDPIENTRALDEGAEKPGVIDIPEFTICFNRDAVYSTYSPFSQQPAPSDMLATSNPTVNKNKAESGEGKDVKDIGLEGEASLATILIQHLFTDFVWTIAKDLPQDCLPFGFESAAKEVGIEGRDRFDPDYLEETWYLPRLSHSKLTELVRQIEVCGLGTTMDIHLCIIPALSFMDRLPNQAMLQLMPPISRDTAWTSVARCYNSLMKMNMRAEKAETFCLTAIVYAMDFLYIAHLPYDTVIQPPEDLREELEKLAATLSSSRFEQAVRSLISLHNLQGRRAAFDSIHRQYKANKDVVDGCLKFYQTPNVEMGEEYPKTVFGFSKGHEKMYSWLRDERTVGDRLGLTRKEAVAWDIFGWTPIHYSCVFNEGGRSRESFNVWWDDILQDRQSVKMHKQLDRFKRSPVHIAAANGLTDVLRKMFLRFIKENNEVSSAVLAAGTDGMTPMHWAAQSMEPTSLEVLIEKSTLTGPHPTDIWGREPIHIAARQGHEKVVGAILKTSTWSLSTDSLGRSPVHYVLTRPPSQKPVETQKTGDDDDNEEAEEKDDKDNKDQNPHTLKDAQRLRILEEFASRKPLWKDDGGQDILLYAAQFAEPELVKNLVESQECSPALADSNGQTALHAALEHNNLPAFRYFLDLPADKLKEVAKAEPSLLIAACKQGHASVIPRIMEVWPEDINRVDSDFDQPPLSWAIERKHNDIVKILVDNGDTDLDRAAEHFNGFTPLHFALVYENNEALALLLEQPSHRIDIEKKNTMWNETPLESAIRSEWANGTKVLLLHPRTPDTDRRRHFRDILRSGNPAFIGIISEVFGYMITNDSLTSEELAGFIADSAALDDPMYFEALLMTLLRGHAWNMVQDPDYPTVQASSAKAIAELLKKGVNPPVLVGNNWSLEDYVHRFGGAELIQWLGDDLPQKQGPTPYPRPETLLWDGRYKSVSTGTCNKPGHTECTGITNVYVAEDTRESHVSIRSNECISPSSSLNHFYFEITVVKDSSSKAVCLGFRRRHASDQGMPGWDGGSWAWHGDNGGFYIETPRIFPLPGSESLHPFQAGDVAGVGLDFDTGQPFCTLNGIRLSMGNSSKRIQHRGFHLGRVYPCVGFQVGKSGQGLHFEVNFGGSPMSHPFRYQGPYVGEIEE